VKQSKERAQILDRRRPPPLQRVTNAGQQLANVRWHINKLVEELEPRRFQNDVQIVKVVVVPIVICGKKAASVTIEHPVLQLLLL
jgi:hypothetical protein